MARTFRSSQDRSGSVKRRKLEFDAITAQVKKDKKRFMLRLTNRLEKAGHCLLYKGTLDHKGYARLNLRYKGAIITIHAHRLFLILKIRKPIPKGYEAGHWPECVSRRCVRCVDLQHYRENAVTRG